MTIDIKKDSSICREIALEPSNVASAPMNHISMVENLLKCSVSQQDLLCGTLAVEQSREMLTPAMFDLREARGEDERLAVFRLRYRTLAEEVGDWRYADKSAGILRDPWDDQPHRLLVVVAPHGEIVGTLRFQLGSEVILPAKESLPMRTFSGLLKASSDDVCPQLSYFSRACMDKRFRIRELFQSLNILGRRMSMAAGARISYCFVKESNHASNISLTRQGWTKIPQSVSLHGVVHFVWWTWSDDGAVKE